VLEKELLQLILQLHLFEKIS